MTEDFRFQVNLGGMIDLLSHNLYSSPAVFIRELLQNAVDAMAAKRQLQEKQSEDSVVFERIVDSNGNVTLMCEDNGIGLTEEEIHQFLATIGNSSKRGEVANEDFIGRFGVGLLSCFIVSDEITVITTSAKTNETSRWRGKADGTYELKKLAGNFKYGTRVYLRIKQESSEWVSEEKLAELLFEFGALLPIPITLSSDGREVVINKETGNWLDIPLELRSSAEVLAFGRKLLEEHFEQYFILTTPEGKTGGIAFVIPHTTSANKNQKHRVYLKRMLVSTQVDNILPEWAFFVRSIIWTDELQPIASRESFYEDGKLDDVRMQLGDSLKQSLLQLASLNPHAIEGLISTHYLAMKAFVAEDVEFREVMGELLPFDSSNGRYSLRYFFNNYDTIYYTETVDEYRQIQAIAHAQQVLVLNGGYVYDKEILSQYERVQKIKPEDISFSFLPLSLQEREKVQVILQKLQPIFQPFSVRCDIRKFQPESITSVYFASDEVLTKRSLERTAELSNELFGGVLANIAASYADTRSQAELVLNLNNKTIRKLVEEATDELLEAVVQVFYVQALLMGHYPLKASELELMNTSYLDLINIGLGVEREGE